MHKTIDFSLPVLGFVAWSGTGKTTLLKRLIPLLKDRGLRIGLVKHAHHSFDIDIPGKDSYELRKAGAMEVVVASRERIASIIETPDMHAEPSLQDALARLNTKNLDLVLVEGFKMEPFPKIELHRKALKKDYLYPDDETIFALAEDSSTDTDDNLNPQRPISCLDLNQPVQIADFITAWFKQPHRDDR